MPHGTTGHDLTRQLELTIDSSARAVLVRLDTVPDPLRTPLGLSAAVDEAFRDAIGSLARTPVRRNGATGRPPTSRRPASVPRPVLDNSRERVPDLAMIDGAGDARPLELSPTGTSGNGCLSVTLGPASSLGEVQVLEPAWLSTATKAHIAGAITEAFEAAYDRRGN